MENIFAEDKLIHLIPSEETVSLLSFTQVISFVLSSNIYNIYMSHGIVEDDNIFEKITRVLGTVIQ